MAARPLRAHSADAAAAAGASELVFVVGYEADAVRDYFGDFYPGVPVTNAIQADQQGTGHAVASAADVLEGDFAVPNGDDL